MTPSSTVRRYTRRSQPSITRLRLGSGGSGIAGQVFNHLLEPLAGARVCTLQAEARAKSRCVLADEMGRFSLNTHWQRSTVALRVRADGYIEREVEFPQGESREKLSIVLGAADSVQIAGQILDSAGGPVTGARIEASAPGSSVVRARAATDVDGNFQMFVSPGATEVSVSAEAYSEVSQVVLAPNERVRVELAIPSTIAGRVLADDGSPVAEARVVASPRRGAKTRPRMVRSDVDGRFRFRALGAGSFEVVVLGSRWRSDSVQVDLAVAQDAENLILLARRVASLSGRVLVDGRECSRGLVLASGVEEASAVVGNGGRVDVQGLRPGSYRVTVRCEGAVQRIETMTVGFDPLEREWNLGSGERVEGSVRNAEGAPVAGARVRIYPQGGESFEHASCTTNSRGEFFCSGLTPGQYACRVEGPHGPRSEPLAFSLDDGAAFPLELTTRAAASIHVQSVGRGSLDGLWIAIARPGYRPDFRPYRSNMEFQELPLGVYDVYTIQSPEIRQRVELRRDGEVAVVLLREPAMTEIAGKVLDDAGSPVLDAWIVAQPASFPLAARSPVTARASSDSDGRFLLEGLPEGTWNLTVTSPVGRAFHAGVRSGVDGLVLVTFENSSDVSRSGSKATANEEESLLAH